MEFPFKEMKIGHMKIPIASFFLWELRSYPWQSSLKTRSNEWEKHGNNTNYKLQPLFFVAFFFLQESSINEKKLFVNIRFDWKMNSELFIYISLLSCISYCIYKYTYKTVSK